MVKRPERLVIHKPDIDPCPDQYVEANEDGRGVGAWVPAIKHRQLCRYIDSAYGAARRWSGGWVYLDPFCSSGRIRVAGESRDRPGGAVAAWQQSKFSGTPFTRVMIGDIRAERVDACAARLRAIGAPVKSFNYPAVEAVDLMVREVPKGALCLAYIDPYSLGALDFEILRSLAQLPHVDFIVNFFTSDLRRNVDAAPDLANPGWRARLSQDLNKAGQAHAYFDDWQRQVQGLGFQQSRAMQTVENSRNAEMYRLVFFAKKAFPVGLWDDVAADPTGDLFAGL